MVVIGCPCDFCVIVACLREEAGDLDDGRHGYSAGVREDDARWFLGGASVRDAVRDRVVLSVMVQRPGNSNGVANGVRNLVGQSRGREQRWDAGDSVGLLESGTWVDRRQGMRLLAALVETASRTLRTALVPRSGDTVDKECWATDDRVGFSTCEAAGSVGQNGVANVVNGVGTSVGWRCGQEGVRWDADDIVGLSTSGRWSGPWSVRARETNGVRMTATTWFDRRQDVGRSASGLWLGCQCLPNGAAKSIGILVGWSRGRKWCWDVGDCVVRSSSGPGSIRVGSSFGLGILCVDRRQGLGQGMGILGQARRQAFG